MKKYLLLLFIILMISCNKTEKNENIDFFQSVDLGAYGSKTRLIIYANFDECGEWGGHKETFEIFSKKNEQFYAKYTRTKVDCNKIGALYGKPEFQQPYVKKEIKLENKQKTAINEYLLSLVESKINEVYPGHAGQNFGVIKTDSTLVIDVYDSNEKNHENYNKLLNEFQLEAVKYE